MQLLTAHWPQIQFSGLYSTAPREHEDQDTFLNAVATFETDEQPEEVVHILRGIEQELKKSPPYKYGPRTIDLDLLLYGDEQIGSEELTVPHPRMHERRFVLEPLCELIDPADTHPVLGQNWQELLTATNDQKCTRIGKKAV
jgi:2-amino-4-hydroxy-6-hydroxymethyldihydropteridine diphosphokinase